VVEGATTHPLSPVDTAGAGLDESWVQRLLESNPECLPIAEIEPAFSGSLSLCRELPTGAGAADNVFINSLGLISIAECKLWRNPEARRRVVAQVLDYAKELARWSYEDFEHAVLGARNDGSKSLIDVARSFRELVDELKAELGMIAKPGRGETLTLNLKSRDNRYNLCSVRETGTVEFYALTVKASEVGARQVAIDYLEGLARLLGGRVDYNRHEWTYRILTARGLPKVSELLRKGEEWKALISDTLRRFQEAEEES